ncbi:unnamed protein product [Acanthoscelides obtectus]|uniref:Uncharacterized protein n=1 Tax=Acanthoscelides obtectus TaxID=200917 RepID=A0A9P0JVG7_ACAOB|nr:unnamed protein product [Acanthoscelides obtectus]CAK1625253.1 hypothetical protein AOBTE_LOCUS3061 [Acanthoscelides obtectus]
MAIMNTEGDTTASIQNTANGKADRDVELGNGTVDVDLRDITNNNTIKESNPKQLDEDPHQQQSSSSEVASSWSCLKRRRSRVFLRRMAVFASVSAVIVAVAALLAYAAGWMAVAQAAVVAAVAYLAAGHWMWFYVAAVTTPRDLR